MSEEQIEEIVDDAEVLEPEIVDDEKHAVIYLEDNICVEVINPIVHYIIEANVKNTLEDITIFIDSPGGDLSAAWKLIDIIKISRVKIRTVGLGGIMSAALLILMAGHERFLSQNSEVMTHQPTFNAANMSVQLKDFVSLTQMFNKTMSRVMDLYREKTGLDGDELKEVLLGNSDEWLTSREAIEFGFADEIIQDVGVDFWELLSQ